MTHCTNNLQTAPDWISCATLVEPFPSCGLVRAALMRRVAWLASGGGSIRNRYYFISWQSSDKSLESQQAALLSFIFCHQSNRMCNKVNLLRGAGNAFFKKLWQNFFGQLDIGKKNMNHYVIICRMQISTICSRRSRHYILCELTNHPWKKDHPCILVSWWCGHPSPCPCWRVLAGLIIIIQD